MAHSPKVTSQAKDKPSQGGPSSSRAAVAAVSRVCPTPLTKPPQCTDTHAQAGACRSRTTCSCFWLGFPCLGGAGVLCVLCWWLGRAASSLLRMTTTRNRSSCAPPSPSPHHPYAHAPHGPLHTKTRQISLPRPRAWRGRCAPPGLRTQGPSLPPPGHHHRGGGLFPLLAFLPPTTCTSPQRLCTTQCPRLDKTLGIPEHAGGLWLSRRLSSVCSPPSLHHAHLSPPTRTPL